LNHLSLRRTIGGVYAPVGTTKRFIQLTPALDVQQVCYDVGCPVKTGVTAANVC